MSARNKRGQLSSWLLQAIAAISLATLAYTLLKPSSSSKSGSKIGKKAKVVILLSQELIDQAFPIEYLLSDFSELVIVLEPGVSKSELEKSGRVPSKYEYRVLSADSLTGVIHIIKHLSFDIVLLPATVASKIVPGIEQFVNQIIELDSDVDKLQQKLHELFF